MTGRFSLDQVMKAVILALSIAGLYYAQKAQTDALSLKLQAVIEAQSSAAATQRETSQKLESVERTAQEIYWTLKAGGIIK